MFRLRFFLLLAIQAVLLLSFQNCSDFELSSDLANSPDETDGSGVIQTGCKSISTPEEFLSMSEGRKNNLNSYCLTKDLDFSKINLLSSSTYLNYISLDGKNHKIHGLKLANGQSLFNNLRESVVKNLILGHESLTKTITMTASPTGVLAKTSSDSTYENIRLLNPKVEGTVSADSACGLLFGSLNDTSLSKIKIDLNESMSFSCRTFGIIASSIYNTPEDSINDIAITSRKNIIVMVKRSVGLLSTGSRAPNISNINIDLAQIDITSGKDTQNGFGMLFGSLYFDDSNALNLKNINLKGIVNLKNFNFSGGLIGDCGGIMSEEERHTFTLDQFNIQTSISLDNSESKWSAGNPLGTICGVLDATVGNFTNGTIQNEFIVTANLSRPSSLVVAGLVGSSYSNAVLNLHLSKDSQTTINTNASQAGQIRKAKYLNGEGSVILKSGSKNLKAFYNSAELTN